MRTTIFFTVEESIQTVHHHNNVTIESCQRQVETAHNGSKLS